MNIKGDKWKNDMKLGLLKTVKERNDFHSGFRLGDLH